MIRQLSFHIPGEWCDRQIGEPACEICERKFHIEESREINNCAIYAWLLTDDLEWGLDFYLTGSASCFGWILEEHLGMYPDV
jgi:hypothetical protein